MAALPARAEPLPSARALKAHLEDLLRSEPGKGVLRGDGHSSVPGPESGLPKGAAGTRDECILRRQGRSQSTAPPNRDHLLRLLEPVLDWECLDAAAGSAVSAAH